MAAFTFGCGGDGGGGTAGTGGGTAGTGGGAAGSGGSGEGGAAGIRANFETSLHNTRAGQEFWYRDTNGGFESLTNVDYAPLTCQGCHNPNDTNWAGVPSCADCHGDFSGDQQLQSSTCLGCHSRQGAELAQFASRDMGVGGNGGMGGYSGDFHTNNFVCADCHKSNDVHGNGTAYDTMLRKSPRGKSVPLGRSSTGSSS